MGDDGEQDDGDDEEDEAGADGGADEGMAFKEEDEQGEREDVEH